MNYVTNIITKTRSVSTAVGVVFLSLLYSSVVAIGATQVANVFPQMAGFFIKNAFPFTGFILGGLTYIFLTEHDYSFIDIDVGLTRKEFLKGIGVGVSCSVLFASLSVIANLANIPVISVGDELGVRGEFNRVLVFMIIVIGFNAPGEEFLYRNVVQKHFTATFTPTSSIVLSSVIFMSVHIPTYIIALESSATGIFGAIIPLVTILLLGGVLGWSYYVTRTLWVPIIGHAVYNIVQLILYSISNGLL